MEKVKRLVDLNVLYCQSELVEELFSKEIISYYDVWTETEEEVLEWWLVTELFADMLDQHNEVVVKAWDCHWWGRTCSGQAVYADGVMRDIWYEMSN